MFPVIRFLGFTLPVGPAFVVLAFYVGSDLGARALGKVAPVQQQEQWKSQFSNAAFVAAAMGLIGARLAYAASYYRLYVAAPQLLLSIRPGTLALIPGLLVGSVAGFFYLQRKDVTLARSIDAVAIGTTGALAVLSLRNFLTGNDYGAPTELPWGVNLWLTTRHPVQLYEMALLLLVLVLLWRYHPRALPGETFWRFVALYSFTELLVAAFRANVSTWLGLRATQVIALGSLLVALWLLSKYAQLHDKQVVEVNLPMAVHPHNQTSNSSSTN